MPCKLGRTVACTACAGGSSDLTTRSSSEWNAPESHRGAQGRSHRRSDRIPPDLNGSEASGLQHAGTQRKGNGRSPPRLVSNSLTSTSASCTSPREAPAGLQHQTTQLPGQQQGPEQGHILRGLQFGPAIPFNLQVSPVPTQRLWWEASACMLQSSSGAGRHPLPGFELGRGWWVARIP